MPFGSIGAYACKGIQTKLDLVFGQNVAEYRTLGSTGLLKWLTSPQNTRGFTPINVESIPGKKRGVFLRVDNPFCFDLCSLAANCNTTRVESTNPSQEVFFEITSDPYRTCSGTGSGAQPDVLSFDEDDLMRYCTETDTSYITAQILRYNKRWIESFDQRIFEIIASKVGTNAKGAATTDLTFFTTNTDTGQSNLNATAIFFLQQLWRDAGNDMQFSLIGGQTLSMIAEFKKWQGLNAMGVDMGNLNEEIPFVFYDRNADTILGLTDFLQLAPGTAQLVTWNKYKGEKRRIVTDLYTHDTFIDPATGIEVDFDWYFDYKCGKWTYEPFLSAELAVNLAGGCGDALAGVNGIVQVHACGQIVDPTCASV